MTRAWSLVLLLAACRGPSTSLFDPLTRLPASSAGVIVATRAGSEGEARAAIDQMVALVGKVPACAAAALAKVEQMALADGADVVFVLHGAGLRDAVDGCARQVGGDQLVITDSGRVTHYASPRFDGYVDWLDGDTALGGPFMDAAATAALRAAPPLTSNAAVMTEVAKIDRTGPMWMAADLGQLGDKHVNLVIPGVALLRVGGTLSARDDSATLVMDTATPADAERLAAIVRHFLASPSEQLRPLAESATVSVLGVMVMVHGDVGAAVRKLSPKLADARAGATVFAVALFAGVVAIPALMKHARKLKTAEAVHNLERMRDGARAYFDAQPAGARRFPPSAGPTPPLGACCAQGKKCRPDPALWTNETWRSLNFSMNDPHYYSYAFVSTGEDVNAAFSVAAYGDLDCDGVYSTFELGGTVASDGQVRSDDQPRVEKSRE